MEHDYNKKEMNEFANEGWVQMKELLQQHGLEEEKRPLSFWIRTTGIAAGLFLAFFISYNFFYIPSQQDYIDMNNLAQSENKSPEKQSTIKQINTLKEENNKVLLGKNAPVEIPVSNKIQMNSQDRKLNTVFIIPEEHTRKWESITKTALSKKITTGNNVLNTPMMIPPGKKDSIKPVAPLFIHQKNEKKNSKKPIEFFAGVGSNISLQKKTGLMGGFTKMDLHPSLRVIIPLNDKLSIHTGLYAMSTLHGNNENTREKEMVNNMTTNLFYKINSTSLIKASYFDIPAVLTYQLTPAWSAGAGLQISRLYRYNVKEKEESFDYNDNLIETNELRFQLTSSPSPSLKNKVTIKNWEPRLVIETGFRKGNFLFSLGYIYGLDESVHIHQPNGNTNQARNEYFKLGVQYEIK